MLLDWNSNKEKRRMHHDNDQSVFTPFSLLLMFMMDIPSSFFVDLNVSTFFSLILGDTFGCHFFYSSLIKWVEGKERRRWRNECECDELFLPLSPSLSFSFSRMTWMRWEKNRCEHHYDISQKEGCDTKDEKKEKGIKTTRDSVVLHPPPSSSSLIILLSREAEKMALIIIIIIITVTVVIFLFPLSPNPPLSLYSLPVTFEKRWHQEMTKNKPDKTWE